MEIKLCLFFQTATTNGWWGNPEALRAAESDKCIVTLDKAEPAYHPNSSY